MTFFFLCSSIIGRFGDDPSFATILLVNTSEEGFLIAVTDFPILNKFFFMYHRFSKFICRISTFRRKCNFMIIPGNSFTNKYYSGEVINSLSYITLNYIDICSVQIPPTKN